VKEGEGNPQTREEEGKLSLLCMEHNSFPAGIPGIWIRIPMESHSFTSPYQPKLSPWCSTLCPWLLSSYLLGTAQVDDWCEGPLLCCGNLLNVDGEPIPAVWLLENHHLRATYLNDGVGTRPLL